jgi:dTDP-4-dehydrorhamnose reductase
MPKQSANKPTAPKVLLVGASGTLGRAVHAELALRHQVLAASRSGPLKVDITDSASIRRLFKKTGKVDAIVCTAGKVHFGALAEMTEEHYAIGLRDKLMGQVT